MFSEEYQREFLAQYFAALDECPVVIGEQLWNYADFMTSQSIMRPGGNRKGVFTRDRRPKSVVADIRARWLAYGQDGKSTPRLGTAV